jgi:hypothetical protein
MTRTQAGAADLELTRVPGDRRLYALAGIGTLRLEGLLGRAATAEADGARWNIARQGFWRREIEICDEHGLVSGTFDPRSIRRGGTLRFGDRELTLDPASSWRERYALAEDGHELVLLDGKGWGRRPVKVSIVGSELLPAALLLFATFIVRGLAEDATSAGAGGATAAVA